jgi:hypothetical protein
MAITDIPEFVELAPGGLIRSEDWNNIQRQVRNSVRAHRHTRLANAPPNDAAAADLALQITTDEIADQAVTAAKLGDGAVTSGKLADGSVSNPKLANNAVGTTKLQNGSISTDKLQANAVDRANIRDGAISLPKLALQEIASANNQNVGANAQVTVAVRNNLPNAQALAAPFFPTLTITGVGAGAGEALVEAVIVYRRTPTSPVGTVDVQLRLRNTGALSATVNWRVLTFAP